MNVYSVISETLWAKVPILDDGSGPKEPYAIVELVSARSRSQARWLAWKGDRDSWSKDVADMPKFHTQLLRKEVGRPAQLVTSDPEFQCLWAEVKEQGARA